MATIATATVAMATAKRTPTSVAALLARRHQLKASTWHSQSRLTCSASSSRGGERKLVLYSKPGCCLCDGLKEKLTAAFSLSTSLNDVVLQVRDITSNPEWERAYQYEIPVLAKVLPDGSEVYAPFPCVSVFASLPFDLLVIEELFWQS